MWGKQDCGAALLSGRQSDVNGGHGGVATTDFGGLKSTSNLVVFEVNFYHKCVGQLHRLAFPLARPHVQAGGSDHQQRSGLERASESAGEHGSE